VPPLDGAEVYVVAVEGIPRFVQVLELLAGTDPLPRRVDHPVHHLDVEADDDDFRVAEVVAPAAGAAPTPPDCSSSLADSEVGAHGGSDLRRDDKDHSFGRLPPGQFDTTSPLAPQTRHGLDEAVTAGEGLALLQAVTGQVADPYIDVLVLVEFFSRQKRVGRQPLGERPVRVAPVPVKDAVRDRRQHGSQRPRKE
jgi:hypothetical protein